MQWVNNASEQWQPHCEYCQTSNISQTLVGSKIVDHSDVIGASPIRTAPTTSSFSTQHLASKDWAKTTARRDEKHLSLWFDVSLITDLNIHVIYQESSHLKMKLFWSLTTIDEEWYLWECQRDGVQWWRTDGQTSCNQFAPPPPPPCTLLSSGYRKKI